MGSDNKPGESTTPSSTTTTTEAEIKVNYVFTILATLVSLGIGFGIASGIYSYGNTSLYEKNIAAVSSNEESYWVFLAIVVFGRMIAFVNLVPASYKKDMNGNVRSNPFFYKIHESSKDEMVVFQEDGNLGKYNRANRSTHHMVENFGGFVAGLVLAGSVFPFPTFVLTCLFALGRVLHQIGYTKKYGGHAPGFLISSVIATPTLEGLLLLVFLKASNTMN